MKKSVFVFLLFVCGLSFSHAQRQNFAIGADISGITEMEAKGQKLYNFRGEEREGTALMRELGMNAVRLRVWVDPSKHGNWCNTDDLLAKALRAKALGMDVMVDFHYSDWWADPAKQNIPEAWRNLPFRMMKKALSEHTSAVLMTLKRHNVTPRWVQVGNETTNGMLWSVEMDPVTGWEKKDANGNTTITKSMGHSERNPEQYAGFIAAGYDAVKAVFPDAQVIVHLDNGFDNDMYNRHLDILKQNGGKWDMIGMSVYPYWAMLSGKEPSARRTIADIMRALVTADSDFSNYDRRVVKLLTTAGDIIVELYNETPVHRDNFVRLAEDSSLDSTLFHRVIKDFMIQGGGPDSRFAPETSKEQPAPPTANEDVPTADGQRQLKAEILYPRFFHKRGALAAAREADGENPEYASSSSQFYIVWGKSPATAGRSPYVPILGYYNDEGAAGTPWLDGGYTVFGEVLSGLDVVEKIQQAETDANDRPIGDIRLMKMEILH